MKGSSGFLFALAEIVIGGLLIASAFRTPPDPRDVLSNALGFSKAPKKAPTGKPSGLVRGQR